MAQSHGSSFTRGDRRDRLVKRVRSLHPKSVGWRVPPALRGSLRCV
ncbi:MAG TPA: hypothetical protein VF553_22030 [Pyrinomonadaceae bacterium]